MNIFVPEEVNFIINTFYQNNFEAYMVGGCIRDALLNKAPKDYDIATSAKPEETISLFEKTIPTGIKHGTITILLNNEPFEATTYRTESDYKDNRHPESVSFVTNIKDDLSRRDFTINAFAYNKKNGLLDYFNGKEDLKNKLIRTVGNSDLRFQEDALRMLRAIRFSSQLNFDIESNTLNGIKRNKELITKISGERIRDELCKILLSPNPKKGFILLKNTGILELIIPEFKKSFDFNQQNPNHLEDVFEHTLSVVEKTKPVLSIRLAALFHDIGKPDCFKLGENNIGHFYGHNTISKNLANTILVRLKLDNKTLTKTLTLISEHMNVLDNPSDVAIKRLITRVGTDTIFDLYDLQKADILSLANPDVALYKIDNMIEKTNTIINSKAPMSIKDLSISGNDLILELNLPKGKIIGETLSYLLELVLENPSLNSKKELLGLASKFIENKNRVI